jgi:hypothetical protein
VAHLNILLYSLSEHKREKARTWKTKVITYFSTSLGEAIISTCRNGSHSFALPLSTSLPSTRSIKLLASEENSSLQPLKVGQHLVI